MIKKVECPECGNRFAVHHDSKEKLSYCIFCGDELDAELYEEVEDDDLEDLENWQ